MSGVSAHVLLAVAVLGTAATAPAASGQPDLAPVSLRCEYVTDPLGIDVAAPRLSWALTGSAPGERQTGYRILVSTSRARLDREEGDLWDSGRVSSDQTTQVAYRGRQLTSSQQVFWKVRVWDKDAAASPWSPVASWTMGVLGPGDWRARWIRAASESPTLLARREFVVAPGLTRAIVHVAGLGQYELSVNGEKVGADVLAPGWTKYDRTCLYDTRDITAQVRAGPNAIGLLLGGGMYRVPGGRYAKFTASIGPLTAIAHLRLEFADGRTEIVGTDGQWRTSPGPITFSCMFGGEDFDGGAEPPGWSEPGFDERTWRSAVVTDGPGGVLKGATGAAPPIGTFEVLAPVHVTELTGGRAVYDLGQNAALMPRLRVRGSEGARVRIVPAELVKPDGTVDRGSVGGGEAYWEYTLKGGSPEVYRPRFFYHGARYLQVERLPAKGARDLPRVDSLEGVVVGSASAPIGTFTTSDDLFNRIHRLVRWAQRSNLMSVVTDCPHRERLGWLEQYHLNGPSLRYEFDLTQLFVKGMNDMVDSQLPNGLVPDIAPEYTVFEGGFRDSPEWGSAVVLVPWQQYEWTGDVDLLRRHYAAMGRYVAYLGTKARSHVLSHGLGDWYDIGPKRPGVAQLTPVALTATAFYYADAKTLARAATLLGETVDAARYEALSGEIRTAFQKAFYDKEQKTFATGSQTANALALVWDLVPEADRGAVLDHIVRDVQQRGNALTAGDVGYRYLLRALADGGRSDVIYAMNHQAEKPGYGYQLKQGATSLTEAWDADRRSSQNHFMLGQINEWFYRDLAGIRSDPDGPGFRKIIIAPQPVGDLTHVEATLESIRGRIVSRWSKAPDNFTLEIEIPPNTSARVFLPAASVEDVVVNGSTPAAAGTTFEGDHGGRLIFAVPAGRWQMRARR